MLLANCTVVRLLLIIFIFSFPGSVRECRLEALPLPPETRGGASRKHSEAEPRNEGLVAKLTLHTTMLLHFNDDILERDDPCVDYGINNHSLVPFTLKYLKLFISLYPLRSLD